MRIMCVVLPCCCSHTQILGVVRDNYDSLTLKLQDNLDVLDKLRDAQSEAAFFTVLTRMIIRAHSSVDFAVAPIRIL